MRFREIVLRMIAGLLSAGAVFWGVFLLLLLARNEPRPETLAFFALIYGPGYIVPAGYLIRLLTTPGLALRRSIWVFSILVQGGWLAVYLLDAVGKWRLNSAPLFGAWWLFATLSSVIALVTEKAELNKVQHPVSQM